MVDIGKGPLDRLEGLNAAPSTKVISSKGGFQAPENAEEVGAVRWLLSAAPT